MSKVYSRRYFICRASLYLGSIVNNIKGNTYNDLVIGFYRFLSDAKWFDKYTHEDDIRDEEDLKNIINTVCKTDSDGKIIEINPIAVVEWSIEWDIANDLMTEDKKLDYMKKMIEIENKNKQQYDDLIDELSSCLPLEMIYPYL